MDNKILDSVKKLLESSSNTYIWGGGPVAQRAAAWYEKQGVRISGHLIGNEYYIEGQTINGKPAICLESFIETEKNHYNIIFCIGRNLKYEIISIDSKLIDNFVIADFSAAFAIENEELNVWDNEFWEEFGAQILKIRNRFCDEESRKAFDEWTYQKRTSLNWKPCSSCAQYFEKEVVSFEDGETFIDVGGYEGETTAEFFSEAGELKNIHAVILEPEKANIEKVKENFGKDNRVTLMPFGAWSEYQKIAISSDSSNSTLGFGDDFVECDTLDRLLEGVSPTYIKMDIEGAEYNALVGARETIKKYTPKLAICVYHKRDDILKITSLLDEITSGYDYFFRSYRSEGIEAVMYAIPKRK